MNEKLQEKYVEFQIADQEVKQAKEQVKAIDKQAEELQVLTKSLSELHTVKDETFIPLNSGVYLKGRIENKESVVINVGANVMVEKPLGDAIKMIKEQLEELDKVREHMVSEYKIAVKKAKALHAEVRALQE